MAHVQIFLSTVSSEFGSYREALRRDLARPNVTVKVQEDFIATGTETLDKLDEYIRQCDAVIHLVGNMTGALAQPPSLAVIVQRYPDLAQRLQVLEAFLKPDASALSYTQWEAWLALYHGKVLIIAVPEDGAPRDQNYRFDERECAAQQAHLKRLASVERYPEIHFANADRLAVDMLRSKLQDILADVGIGRDVRNSVIITGDGLFQLLLQAPEPLSRHVQTRAFKTFIEKKTKHFIGREFIFTAIDNWLRHPDFPSGYILIRGEPGIGKTALLAQLVRQRGYVHHFNIATQGIRSHRDFLRNVCAQLIVRYQLEHTTLPSEALESSGFLSQLLDEAAAARPSEEPIVLLVDALDEAEDTGLDPKANRLYLPGELPDHVYFVVTTRPRAESDYGLNVNRLEPIYINESDPHNLDDIQRYIQRFISTHRESMETRLAEWGATAEEFVTVLTKKSEGNFLYLVHVLGDIAGGRITAANINDIRNLPQGLRPYYGRHWLIMRAQAAERFDQLYQPVVCQLATVEEPVSITRLAEWTHLSQTDIRRVLSAWREFLDEQMIREAEPLYRVYHASFRDFLHDEVGLQPYHAKISETAFQKIKKIAQRLRIRW